MWKPVQGVTPAFPIKWTGIEKKKSELGLASAHPGDPAQEQAIMGRCISNMKGGGMLLSSVWKHGNDDD